MDVAHLEVEVGQDKAKSKKSASEESIQERFPDNPIAEVLESKGLNSE